MADLFYPAGVGAVKQDARGTAKSEGEFTLQDLSNNRNDTIDTVRAAGFKLLSTCKAPP